MLDLLHTLLSFAVVTTVVVFIHEFGHYLVARLCGVKVEVFSVGFGKELFGYTDRSGTRWKFAALPLGGYVKMFGDASAASTADEEKMERMSEAEKKLTFHHKSLPRKAAIVAAGPVANFLLTIGVFTYFIMTVGLASTEPVVGSVLPGTAAAEAGLKAGDHILTINGEHVKRFSDIPMKIATNMGTPVEIVFLRKDVEKKVTLTPRTISEIDALGNASKRPLIGIKSLEMKYEDVGLVAALQESVVRTWQICETTLVALGQIITGERSATELKGPVGIAEISGQAAAQGAMTLLWLIAMLSANLGFINLLPIPLLDGGHLAFYTAEALQGRPLAEKVQEWGYRIGFAFIATLMAFTLLNDLWQLFAA